MPTIAYVLGTFPARTETFVLREIAALRRRGFTVFVLAIRRPAGGDTASESTAFQIDGACLYARPDRVLQHAVSNAVYLLTRPRRYLTALSAFVRQTTALSPREALQLLFHFFAGAGFVHDLQRRGVSHLHCHFTSGANVALAMNLLADTSFSFTAHASNDLFVRPVLLPEKTARARFIVPVCDYSQRYLDSVTGFRFSHKMHRIYNGVEVGEPAPARPSGALRVVSVGSLVSPKGHATLIQVCARLHVQGRKLECRIVGEGPERATLERLIEAHQLRGVVRLMGALTLDGVYSELRGADVFALLAEIGPSGYRDGFPTAILEAMAAGLPVLSTTLSGIPEMVLDGVTGRLVPERDVQAATAALEGLLDSDERRRTMGASGRSRVRKLFQVDQSVAQLAALLLSTAPSAERSLAGPAADSRHQCSGMG